MAYTLLSALSTLRWLTSVYEVQQDSTGCRILYDRATGWRDRGHREIRRALAFGKRFLVWLEMAVLSEDALPADRMVCGRLRMATGGSVRHDGCRNTPVGRLGWILNGDGTVRAMRTRAAAAKTFPRHWACSSLGVCAAGDGWLEQTYLLLRQAHGSGLGSDDHLGKRDMLDRASWDVGPPGGPSDASHVRLLASEARAFGHSVGFADVEIQNLRLHSSKPTLISLGMHRREDRQAVRFQGGWKGNREDLMPDTYLRASQLLSIEMQEGCLRYLRAGGEVIALRAMPASSVLPPGAPGFVVVEPDRCVSSSSSSSSSPPSADSSKAGRNLVTTRVARSRGRASFSC